MSALDDFEPASIAFERERLRGAPRYERLSRVIAWVAIGFVLASFAPHFVGVV